MAIRRVSRIALDGSTITMTMGRHQIPSTKASYGDKLETEVIRNMGAQEISARTPGIYSTEDAKVTMESVTFREVLYPLLQQSGYGNEQIPIVFAFTHPDLGDDSDLLEECRFVGIAQALEASAKALEVEFGIVFNQLYLGNDRKTINAIDPSVPLNASQF
jgi:hypothetical protein